MADEIQKSFVRSFIGFLEKQLKCIYLPEEAHESIIVAIQCLQTAFDVADDDALRESVRGVPLPANATLQKKVDLFELYEAVHIERTPDNRELAETIKIKANNLMEDGKYYEALLHYNRAIAFDPKNPIYYCNRAAAYIRLEDYQHAVADCKTAISYDRNYAKAYGRLSIAYSKLGKVREADEAYNKAIQLDPNDVVLRQCLDLLRIGRRPTSSESASTSNRRDSAETISNSWAQMLNSANMTLERARANYQILRRRSISYAEATRPFGRNSCRARRLAQPSFGAADRFFDISGDFVDTLQQLSTIMQRTSHVAQSPNNVGDGEFNTSPGAGGNNVTNNLGQNTDGTSNNIENNTSPGSNANNSGSNNENNPNRENN